MTIIYTTMGSGRGGCGHKHRTREAADVCLSRDMDGCHAQGGYSDRAVLESDEDGYLVHADGDNYYPYGPGSCAASVDDIGR